MLLKAAKAPLLAFAVMLGPPAWSQIDDNALSVPLITSGQVAALQNKLPPAAPTWTAAHSAASHAGLSFWTQPRKSGPDQDNPSMTLIQGPGDWGREDDDARHSQGSYPAALDIWSGRLSLVAKLKSKGRGEEKSKSPSVTSMLPRTTFTPSSALSGAFSSVHTLLTFI